MKRVIELRMESEPANIAAVRRAIEAIAGASADEKTVGEIGLCLNETLANVIRHAYSAKPGQPIELRVEAGENEVCIRIRDWGNGVDPSTLPETPYDPLTPGGVGLICLKELMDEVSYAPQPDGMLTTLRKRWKVKAHE